MPSPCFVIVNPRAGAGLDHPDFVAEVRSMVAEAGLDARFAESSDVSEQIREAKASGAQTVMVVGGDGTVMAAAEAFAGTGTVLAIVPAGTMNVLAHELDLPLDLADAIRLAGEGEVQAIDVGDVNGHIFIGTSMLGMPPRLAKRREELRGRSSGQGYVRLVRAAIRGLRRYPAVGVCIETGDDHEPIFTRAITVVVGDFAEGVGKVLTRACLDDGHLVVYALKPVASWRLLGLAGAVLLGRWRRDERLLRLSVERVRITARRKRVRVMNDGETLLITPPLDYSIRPKALKVLVPRKADGDDEEQSMQGQAAT